MKALFGFLVTIAIVVGVMYFSYKSFWAQGDTIQDVREGLPDTPTPEQPPARTAIKATKRGTQPQATGQPGLGPGPGQSAASKVVSGICNAQCTGTARTCRAVAMDEGALQRCQGQQERCEQQCQ